MAQKKKEVKENGPVLAWNGGDFFFDLNSVWKTLRRFELADSSKSNPVVAVAEAVSKGTVCVATLAEAIRAAGALYGLDPKQRRKLGLQFTRLGMLLHQAEVALQDKEEDAQLEQKQNKKGKQEQQEDPETEALWKHLCEVFTGLNYPKHKDAFLKVWNEHRKIICEASRTIIPALQLSLNAISLFGSQNAAPVKRAQLKPEPAPAPAPDLSCCTTATVPAAGVTNRPCVVKSDCDD